MKHKVLVGILLLSFTPLVVASFLEEMDQHVADQNIFPDSRFEFSEEVISELPEVLDEIDDDRLKQIRSEIFWEENALELIEQKLRDTENELWSQQSQRRSIEEQISLIDQEISLVSSQLEEYSAREKYHKALLNRLTKEKSLLEATIRVRKRMLERLAIRNFLRRGNKRHTQTTGLPRQDFFMTQWLFSQRQLSEVIETYRKDAQTEAEYTKEIQELEALQKYLVDQEKVLAYQTGISEKLADQIAHQKSRLTTFTDAQSELRDRLYRDEQSQQQLVDVYRQQQLQSTFALQDLRLQLKNTEDGKDPLDTTSIVSESFGYPVQTPVRITAYFEDPEYEKRFNLRHDGVDFASPQGSDVFSVASGEVVKIVDNGLGYSYLIVEHPGDMFSLYGHVSAFLVREGERVSKGQTIALSGGTPGTSGAGYFTTGPHLHLEFFKNGQYVNPLQFIVGEE